MGAAWVDYDAVKLIPIRSVLARYGIEASGKTLRCPLPSHTSKKRETSFSIKENFWQCFSPSCAANRGGKKGGDIIHFVMAMENVERNEAAQKLAEWFAIKSEKPHQNGDARVPAEPPDSLPSGNKPLSFPGLKDVNPEHPIIQARGITVETAREWGVGFFPGKGSMLNRIVFPLHENGVGLVGYSGRATLPDQQPKWLLGKGLVKSFLYGLERCNPAKPLILAESPWAVLFFFQQGVQAAALLGSEMTQAQEQCLAAFGLVIVALDNDAAGENKSRPIVERLRAAGHKVMKARLME